MLFQKRICPICVIVAGTWIFMLLEKWLGYDVNETLMAMLMGGSVVGVAYSLGGRLRLQGKEKMLLFWKLVAIPLGFVIVYALFHFWWWGVTLFVLLYVVVWVLFNKGSGAQDTKRLKDITKALDDCCE